MEKYAVITGASSGLGVDFSIELAKLGYNLVIVARRENKLNELKEKILNEINKDLDIIVLPLDLSVTESCKKLTDFVNELDVEILINNAGFGNCEKFIYTPLSKELEMINVNITTLHILTKKFLAKMVNIDSGFILNVSSSAGLTPAGPYMSTYYATKSYVSSLTRGINYELKEQHSNVYIGILCPGPVDTEFNKVANVKFGLNGITSSYCVKYTIKKMLKKKTVIIPTFKMKFAVVFGRFIPQKLLIKILAKQQKKKM